MTISTTVRAAVIAPLPGPGMNMRREGAAITSV